MVIRKAELSDIDAVAAVHLAAWRETYPGIMPDAMLASLTLQDRIDARRRFMTDPVEGQVNLLLSEGGEVRGFLDAGPSRVADTPADAEIYAVYLLRSAQRRGLGRALVRHAAPLLRQAGFSSLILDVAAENAAARAFYERLGGRVHGPSRCHAVGGFPVLSVFYVFDDLAALAG